MLEQNDKHTESVLKMKLNYLKMSDKHSYRTFPSISCVPFVDLCDPLQITLKYNIISIR
jgi:hypothetical protein